MTLRGYQGHRWPVANEKHGPRARAMMLGAERNIVVAEEVTPIGPELHNLRSAKRSSTVLELWSQQQCYACLLLCRRDASLSTCFASCGTLAFKTSMKLCFAEDLRSPEVGEDRQHDGYTLACHHDNWVQALVIVTYFPPGLGWPD